MLANIIVAFIILFILGGAVAYILRAKKRGIKCIGCDSGGKSCGCSHSSSKDVDDSSVK